jgi:hypothetical protein
MKKAAPGSVRPLFSLRLQLGQPWISAWLDIVVALIRPANVILLHHRPQRHHLDRNAIAGGHRNALRFRGFGSAQELAGLLRIPG